MTEFTPFTALIGGAILGASALLLLWINGNIAGISGIVSRAIKAPKEESLWRWMFILGLVVGPMLTGLIGMGLPAKIDLSWSMTIVGGLLVGVGSRLGSGCTSGHGICGIGRASARSISATIGFMLTALVTVFIVRHIVGAQL